MDFVSNQEPQVREMLEEIGVDSIEALFQDIPESLRIPRPEIDDGMSEYEGIRHMESLAANNTFPQYDNYLGAGAYEHHIPALVPAVTSKSEFLTAYTPYQPEASQGMLQSIFEFQSAICALTGMEVANASLYDCASACAEALLMALRANKKRSKIVVFESVHPHYRFVMKQYLKSLDVELEFSTEVDESTAAVLVQSPNFFGQIEDVGTIFSKAKEVGALCILCANPMAYGMYAPAGELGADIAVGDCQPFGIPLQYGGPYAGYIACCQELVRQLPGRIVGETVDTEGRRGFVLTLQAREQHIRREKAKSNICTNQALAAMASLVAMLWYGKEGVKRLAMTNYQRTAYLINQLEKAGFKTVGTDAHFNEFVVDFGKPADEVKRHFMENQIVPGLHLGGLYPDHRDHFLVAVTEVKNKDQLDRYVEVARGL